jgi:hypothetical protein
LRDGAYAIVISYLPRSQIDAATPMIETYVAG